MSSTYIHSGFRRNPETLPTSGVPSHSALWIPAFAGMGVLGPYVIFIPYARPSGAISHPRRSREALPCRSRLRGNDGG